MKEYTLITNYGNLKFDSMDELYGYLKMLTDQKYFPIGVQIVNHEVRTRFGPSLACPFFYKPLTDFDFESLKCWYGC